MSEKTVQQLNDLQEAVSPFAENHSQVVRITITLFHESVVVTRKINLKEIVLRALEQ